MYFDELQSRLIAALKARLRSGELTERRLARLTGISQPHVHNVLKGVRVLSPELADQVLRRLRISLLDLFAREELAFRLCSACPRRSAYQEVPVLDGWLGPGLPMPRMPSRVERYPFPRSYLAPLMNPILARLSADPWMAGVLSENDLVLLDHSPQSRSCLGADTLYVVNRSGEGIVRRLRLEKQSLLLMTAEPPAGTGPEERIALLGRHLLDIVHARVTWIGRRLAAG